MSRTKLIGWTAMAVCVLGYGAAVALAVLGKLDHLTQALLMAGGAALIGEIGLWIAAGCLGLTIFKRRKALLDRLFRRRPATSPEV